MSNVSSIFHIESFRIEAMKKVELLKDKAFKNHIYLLHASMMKTQTHVL